MGQESQPSKSIGGKPRGRPRKSLDENQPQDEARARGRRAQKLFRLRQQALVKTLEQRTNSLEDVIEAMSREFMALGDKIMLEGDTLSQPKMLVDIKETTERFLEIARSVEHISISDDTTSVVNAISRASANSRSVNRSLSLGEGPIGNNSFTSSSTTLQLAGSKAVRSHSAGVKFDEDDRAGANLSQAILQPFPLATGSFSPRLDYGLFGTSPRQFNPIPPVPWSHYLIAEPNSFAMRLYIDTLDMVWKALRGEIIISGFVPSVCRYRFRYERPDTFIGLLRRQLNLLSPGHERSNTTFEPDEASQSLVLLGPSDYAAMKIIPQIVKDAREELGVLDDWLDPWGAQQYILSKWEVRLTSTTIAIPAYDSNPLDSSGEPQWNVLEELPDSDILFDDAFPTTESVTVGNSFPAVQLFGNETNIPEPALYGSNASHQDASKPQKAEFYRSKYSKVQSIQPLMQRLSISALCFGDGPRFLKANVERIMENFLQDNHKQ